VEPRFVKKQQRSSEIFPRLSVKNSEKTKEPLVSEALLAYFQLDPLLIYSERS